MFDNLNITDFILLLTCFINLVISIVIVVNSQGRLKINLSFVGINFALILWVFSNFQIDRVSDFDIAMFWTKLSGLGVLLLGVSFRYFSKYFPFADSNKGLGFIFISFIPFIFLSFITLFTNHVVSDIDQSVYPVKIAYGNAYFLLIGWLLLNFTLSFADLINKYRNTDKKLFKTQIKFLLYGFAGLITISLITNFVFPAFFSITGLTRIGPLTSIWLTSVFTFLIFKHKLFDVRILLGRMLYYLLLSSFAYFVSISATLINTNLFGSPLNSFSLVMGIIFATLFAVSYEKLEFFVKNKLESRIINPRFNSNEEIARFNSKIRLLLNKEQIIEESLSVITKTLRPEFKAIIISNNEKDLQVFGGDQKPIPAEKLVQLGNYLSSTRRRHINIYELEIQELEAKNNNDYLLLELLRVMNEFNIKLIIILKHTDGKLIGFVTLGQRDNDVPYSSSEINFIIDLCNLLETTLARSQLYEEVTKFNQTLQQKVDNATQELQVSNKKLGEALRKERDMMDILGHELRTPLGTARNAILMIDNLKDKNKLSKEEFEKYLNIAIDNLRREKDLLETILQSARLENSKLQLNIEKVKIEEVINDTFTAFREQAKKRGLQLIVEEYNKELYVHADRMSLQQVLDNLVSNAIKYTPKGSIIIRVMDLGSEVQFSIIDTGEGISEENMRNLGKKFYRINTHLETGGTIGGQKIVRPGGTGIGLYVVKGLLEAMGSNLNVKSKVDVGSTFYFSLKKFN